MPTTTTITNTSDITLHLTWVPPHGVTLAPSESVEIPGDITWYHVMFGRVNARKNAAMEACINDNLVTVAVETT